MHDLQWNLMKFDLSSYPKKRTMNLDHQYALFAKKTDDDLGFIRQSITNRQREVIFPL